jgi:mycothione reductase
MKKYDLIAIGSGGVTKISTYAAKMGLKVALVEKSKLGGTCLNRGCIPSKMIIYPANVATLIREDTKKFDMKVKIENINFGKIIRRISKTVDGESSGIKEAYSSGELLDYYNGHARFISDKVIEVNGKKLTAKKIFVATGARPSIPPIEGLKGTPYMTSTEALRNTKVPKKLIVIGSGYIGCELGHAYGGLGSEVHIITRSELIKREDKDVRKEFTKVFSKLYNIHQFSPTKVSFKDGTFTVSGKDKSGKKKSIKGDALLVATGVKPNTDDLGLDKTSIHVNKKGFIEVNNFLETAVPEVYALGDCIGRNLFRHAVNFEGETLFENLYVKKQKKAIKYPPMPHAVFTYPEIAGVGKTEDELIASKKEYIVGMRNYKSSAMGMARLSEFGFVKLLFDKKNKKLLGAQIIGEEAATMVHQLIYAMTFKATVDDLDKIIYIHPALPEVVKKAVRDAKAKF